MQWLPHCLIAGVSLNDCLQPYGPLAGGTLTDKYHSGGEAGPNARHVKAGVPGCAFASCCMAQRCVCGGCMAAIHGSGDVLATASLWLVSTHHSFHLLRCSSLASSRAITGAKGGAKCFTSVTACCCLPCLPDASPASLPLTLAAAVTAMLPRLSTFCSKSYPAPPCVQRALAGSG